MPKETFCVKCIKSNCFSNGCNPPRATVHDDVSSVSLVKCPHSIPRLILIPTRPLAEERT